MQVFFIISVEMEPDVLEKDSGDKPPSYDELSEPNLKDPEPPSYQCAVMTGRSA